MATPTSDSPALPTSVSVTVRAPAKINLFLELLSRRADGYHEIVTVMQALDLCDTVIVQRASDGITLTVDDPALPTGQDNLAYRAAALFFTEMAMETKTKTKTRGGVRIDLQKRIPVGAGLGGGSSDAAAVLRGLNRLYGCGLSAEALERLAARLGSDVAFFVRGGLARCTGRGEVITKLASRCQPYFLLCAAPIEVPTREVYRQIQDDEKALRGSQCRDAAPLEAALAAGDLQKLPDALFNRLEATAIRLYPELARLRELLRRHLDGALALQLSGSGGCFFALYGSRQEAVRAQEHVRRAEPELRTFVCSPEPVVDETKRQD